MGTGVSECQHRPSSLCLVIKAIQMLPIYTVYWMLKPTYAPLSPTTAVAEDNAVNSQIAIPVCAGASLSNGFWVGDDDV